MIDINELRRLAQAATAGEWYVERGDHIYGRNEVTDKEEVWHPVIACTDDDEINVNFEANAAFIAAANPAAISELLYRLEAAESDAAHQKSLAESALRVAEGWERKCGELRAALQHETDCVEAAKAEIEALRAKIAEMEKQDPPRLFTPTAYRWRRRGSVMWQYGELTEETARLAKEHNHEVQSLYALPGAQNVPTALLVAVANLVAQMEIVSRVGFVDTPDDKDSCAAFCVAVGTWLELVSAVESLASALEAAPEAKP